MDKRKCGKTRLIIPMPAPGSEPWPKGRPRVPYTLWCGKPAGHDDHNLPLDGRYHFDSTKQKGWHPPVERILEETETLE